MINELYSVYEGLIDIGEIPEIKHNDIASPGMNTTFRVCLNKSGIVNSVELLNREKIQDTWSLGDGNKNQFPAAKFEYPFMPDGNKPYQIWKKENTRPDAKAYREMLNHALKTYSFSLPDIEQWPSYRDRIQKRYEQLKEPLKRVEGGLQIKELYDRYFKAENNGIAIPVQIAEKFNKMIDRGSRDELKFIADVLFGDVLVNGKIKDIQRVTFLIDCLPQKDIDIYASSRSRVPVLSQALFEIEQGSDKKMGVCAILGNKTEITQYKFPSQKLSVIGPTILLAKSETSGETVRRYDKSGVDSFRLGKLIGGELAASVAFLTQRERENITWKNISSSSTSLLLAYCKSNFKLAITPIITGGDIDDYENITKSIFKLLQGGNHVQDEKVEICEIRKINDGNRQINYSVTSSIKKLRKFANEWTKACKNVPDFKLFVKFEQENKLMNTWAIAPIEVMNLTKSKYIRSGQYSTSVSPLSFAEIMNLFLSHSDGVNQLALRTIKKLAHQVEPLFEYCALSKIQGRLKKNQQRVKTDEKKNFEVLKTVTLFGVLLFKIKRNKEAYMSSFAYQLGQLCSAMDELHIGYCQDVRKGDIPNTLIGNTTYTIALQSPIKSLALLASRIRPYEAWADKRLNKYSSFDAVSDKVVKNGLFARLWMKNQSPIIAKHFDDTSQVVNDTYKAELMLGYLAGRSFNDKNDTSNKEGEAK